MLWKAMVCCGAWLLVMSSRSLIGANKHDPRTVSFSRTLRPEKLGQVRSRSRRESWFGASSFAYCRQPLTQSEHETLDQNTHEVRNICYNHTNRREPIVVYSVANF